MADKKNWKDHFLSSGVPLEYSILGILKKLGFSAPREYRYERISESGLLTEFSIDVHSSYILRKPNLWLEVFIECKYRHDGTRWAFTPTEHDIWAPRYEDMFVLLDQYDTSRRLARDKVQLYGKNFSLCAKGIELLPEDKNPKAIEQAVQQLRYSIAKKAVDSIVHQVDEMLGSPTPIFMLIPIIITTAELWRMKPNMSVEDIRKAENLEEVAEMKNAILMHNDPDNMLISHTRNYFKNHLSHEQKKKFEAVFMRNTKNSYDYFVDMFASRYPSLFVVSTYSYFETFSKGLVQFVNDNALIESREQTDA
jgi:hypothetical protein